MSRTPRRMAALALGAAVLVTGGVATASAQDAAPLTAEPAADCVPGTTGRIAFLLKQQTAFRYLNADIPFFTEAAEAAGYEVLVQSAENDASIQVGQAGAIGRASCRERVYDDV